MVVVAHVVRQQGPVTVAVDRGKSGTHEQGSVTVLSSMQAGSAHGVPVWGQLDGATVSVIMGHGGAVGVVQGAWVKM